MVVLFFFWERNLQTNTVRALMQIVARLRHRYQGKRCLGMLWLPYEISKVNVYVIEKLPPVFSTSFFARHPKDPRRESSKRVRGTNVAAILSKYGAVVIEGWIGYVSIFAGRATVRFGSESPELMGLARVGLLESPNWVVTQPTTIQTYRKQPLMIQSLRRIQIYHRFDVAHQNHTLDAQAGQNQSTLRDSRANPTELNRNSVCNHILTPVNPNLYLQH